MSFKKIAIISIIGLIFWGAFIAEEPSPATVATSDSEAASEVIPVEHNEPALFAEWQDPKTGLIWLKCAIGEELQNGVCVQAQVTHGSIHEKIRELTDPLASGKSRLYDPTSLYEGTDDSRASGLAEIKFTYAQAQEIVTYLNNQNFNGSSKWRLPKVSELAALRHCSSGWMYVSDAVIPTGRTVLSEDNDGISPELRAHYLAAGISVAATPTRREVPETISVRHRCNLSSSWEQIKFYSAFDALSPIEPKYYDSQWDVSVPYWAWTSNFDVSNYRDSIWIVNPIFGGLRIIKPNENSMSFSNAVYVFLVRDN